MKCPYCHAREDRSVPVFVYRNAECYGGGMRNFRCNVCGKVIRALVNVEVKILQAKQTNGESDW